MKSREEDLHQKSDLTHGSKYNLISQGQNHRLCDVNLQFEPKNYDYQNHSILSNAGLSVLCKVTSVLRLFATSPRIWFTTFSALLCPYHPYDC